MAYVFTILMLISLVGGFLALLAPRTFVFWKPTGLRTRKSALVYFVAAFASLVVVALLAPKVPKNSTIEKSTPQKNVRQQQEAAISVPAQQLLQEYASNELRANKTYEDKLIQVTGVIKSIGEDILGDPYVSIGQGPALSSVQCFFDKSDIDRLTSLQPGQNITITGRCSGKMMNVLVKDCTL